MDSDLNTPKWKPVGRELRRILGVLVEKAKTTPDHYPMTVNAIVTGANQKSNRSPKMELTAEDVEDALYELREIRAVVEIQSDGRKFKYKHLLYDWLDVDKVQLAIMAELLLRGEQTLGDLRARASRMERIDGLSDLKPLVQQLIDKNLILPLTPEGRGQIVTHNLYLPDELAKLERQSISGNRLYTDTTDKKTDGTTNSNQSFDFEQQLRDLNEKVQQLSVRVTQLEKKSTD